MLQLFQKVQQADAVIKTHPLHGLPVKLGNRVLQPIPEGPARFGQYHQSGPPILGVRYPNDMPVPFHSFEHAVEVLATDVQILFELIERGAFLETLP